MILYRIGELLRGEGSFGKLASLGLMYASKSGAILVGVFALPIYQKILGPEVFGVVALILSLQAFLLMLDLGTSTLVGRDIAITKEEDSQYLTWRASEFVLHVFYFIILFAVCAVHSFVRTEVTISQLVLCVFLFWSVTVQNVGISALLAKRKFFSSSVLQISGVVSRAAITIFSLKFIDATLGVFLISQAGTAVVQMWATSYLCKKNFKKQKTNFSLYAIKAKAKQIAKDGQALVFLGLAGAAVLQLDKVIIPVFISPAALTPYFLASALCLTPISVLAGPINQYFFPGIVERITRNDHAAVRQSLRQLIVTLAMVVAVPTVLLWVFRSAVVDSWLHHQTVASDVAEYVKILLPGVALGALGYVPYNILIAHKDYKAHSLIATFISAATLLATVFAAMSGSVLGVCWIYAAYHVASVTICWLRAIALNKPDIDNYSLYAAGLALKIVFFIMLVFGAIYQVFFYIRGFYA